MNSNVYNPKVHNKKLLTILVFAAIVVMFLVRAVLYQNGTIEDMQTLEPEKIRERAAQYEVQVSVVNAGGQSSPAAEGTSFGGTILDGRKQSTKEENFTLTIATSAEAAVPTGNTGNTPGSSDDPDGTVKNEKVESSVYEPVAITLPDGTQADGSVLYVDPDSGFAFVQCEFPTEVEAYYSRDILERLTADDPVYVLQDGNLLTGKTAATKQEISGIGSDLTVVSFDASAPRINPGSGLYGTGGNYLGMYLQQSDDGKAAFASAVDIMKVLKQEL